MLDEFIIANRFELLRRCHAASAKRNEGLAFLATVQLGIPAFLSQLTDTLQLERNVDARNVTEPARPPAHSSVSRTAAEYGAELLSLGFTVEQVVHEYGDVCQAITGLAIDMEHPISTTEFRTLNRCLDNAIADAVTPFDSTGHRFNGQAVTLCARLDAFVLEQSRLLATASQAFSAIRTGAVGIGGPTGQLLGHALGELRNHSERTLPQLYGAIASLGNVSTTEHSTAPTQQ